MSFKEFNVSHRTDQAVFGKKKAEKHILILASGDRIRHMTVQPWMFAVALCFIGMFSVGYLVATTYLVMRDDLIGATMARQASMQHEYEDRIAALRAQVDRITSRQLLDQQVVEDKVEKLLERQAALSDRHGKLGSLIERASSIGLETDDEAAPAAPATDDRAALEPLTGDMIIGPDDGKTRDFKLATLAEMPSGDDSAEPVADRADRLFSKVTLSLKSIERDQVAQIQALTDDAAERAKTIRKIIANTGLKVPADVAAADIDAGNDMDAVGGPYEAPQSEGAFEQSLVSLDTALNRLETMRSFALALPLANPAPGHKITSTFGNRLDPFFRKLAMHAGIDFRQPVGTKIRSTGKGRIIHAGPAGGYGLMVEIDHGNGITTRYGHLSRVLVREGDEVDADQVIALSGSTGRSTGPHLHYEVRRNGKAIDPMRFLNAGMKLTKYL